MKTEAVLDKYRKIIAGLLGINWVCIKIYTLNHSISSYDIENSRRIGELFEDKFKTNNLKEIGELIPYEGGSTKDDIHNWCEGKYIITINKETILAAFELYRLPHCCAIMVSCKSIVNSKYRNKRVGTTLNLLRQDISRQLGYSLLMCTDISSNEHQRKLLETNGWSDIYKIENKRTNNQVHIHVINL